MKRIEKTVNCILSSEKEITSDYVVVSCDGYVSKETAQEILKQENVFAYFLSDKSFDILVKTYTTCYSFLLCDLCSYLALLTGKQIRLHLYEIKTKILVISYFAYKCHKENNAKVVTKQEEELDLFQIESSRDMEIVLKKILG